MGGAKQAGIAKVVGIGTRKVDLYGLDDAASTARPHQGRFGIGFVAE